MPRQSPYVIELSKAEHGGLAARARKYTSPYRDVIRAKIVLLAAKGLANDVIAARLDTPRQVVSQWRTRFYRARLPGLEEVPRDATGAIPECLEHGETGSVSQPPEELGVERQVIRSVRWFHIASGLHVDMSSCCRHFLAPESFVPAVQSSVPASR